MIKVENIEVWGWDAAIRGMRNPMNSWDKSDSGWYQTTYGDEFYKIGSADMQLMQKLFKAGNEHRKFLRMIHVTMDIVAPLYWWKEFDTYKVGTTANSCSTMHKLTAKPFKATDFSCDKLGLEANNVLQALVNILNRSRKDYLDSKDKYFWWQMIQLLPSSYNQRRTVDFDYETAFSMIRQRTGHKLDEWNAFVEILKDLPYVKDIGDLNEESNHVQRVQSCSTDAIEHV